MPLLSLRGAPLLPPRRLAHAFVPHARASDRRRSIVVGQVVPHLLEHFQVLRYDLRGHGETETTSGPYDIELLSDDPLSMASAMGWEQFSVCGISIGAMTAVKLRRRPQRGDEDRRHLLADVPGQRRRRLHAVARPSARRQAAGRAIDPVAAEVPDAPDHRAQLPANARARSQPARAVPHVKAEPA